MLYEKLIVTQLTVYHHDRNRRPPVPKLSQFNPTHASYPQPCVFKVSYT